MTNPFQAVYDNVTVLGHSGQPVSDIARQRIEQVLKAEGDKDTGTIFLFFDNLEGNYSLALGVQFHNCKPDISIQLGSIFLA